MITFPYIINIARPYPNTNENEIIIKYIEPLRKANLVTVSSAYMFNLSQYNLGKECSLSPGFKYMFWFKDEHILKSFKDMMESQRG